MNSKEKTVILFLCITFLIGAGVSLVRNYKTKKNFDKISIKKETNDTIASVRIDSNDIEEYNISTHELHININTASVKELEALPGIGPVLARRIDDYRKNNNGFKTKEELLKVSGIGSKKFSAIKDKIIISR